MNQRNACKSKVKELKTEGRARNRTSPPRRKGGQDIQPPATSGCRNACCISPSKGETINLSYRLRARFYEKDELATLCPEKDQSCPSLALSLETSSSGTCVLMSLAHIFSRLVSHCFNPGQTWHCSPKTTELSTTCPPQFCDAGIKSASERQHPHPPKITNPFILTVRLSHHSFWTQIKTSSGIAEGKPKD